MTPEERAYDKALRLFNEAVKAAIDAGMTKEEFKEWFDATVRAGSWDKKANIKDRQ
jgi:hypothetical protein